MVLLRGFTKRKKEKKTRVFQINLSEKLLLEHLMAELGFLWFEVQK